MDNELKSFYLSAMSHRQRVKIGQAAVAHHRKYSKNFSLPYWADEAICDLEMRMRGVTKQLVGRLANGAERDHGTVVHYVNGFGALCGAKPGRRSVGWTIVWDVEITCPRCKKLFNEMSPLLDDMVEEMNAS